MHAKIVVLHSDGTVEEQTIDASPMSPYTHEIIKGTPTFVGAWNDVYMLAPKTPRTEKIPTENIPAGADRDVASPALLTRLNEDFEPVDFTLEDYRNLQQENVSCTAE